MRGPRRARLNFAHASPGRQAPASKHDAPNAPIASHHCKGTLLQCSKSRIVATWTCRVTLRRVAVPNHPPQPPSHNPCPNALSPDLDPTRLEACRGLGFRHAWTAPPDLRTRCLLYTVGHRLRSRPTFEESLTTVDAGLPPSPSAIRAALASYTLVD